MNYGPTDLILPASVCPECLMGGGRHRWSCGRVPEEGKAAHFERWARTFLNGQERYREAMQQRNAVITALQGKCAVLKLENNKLRRKLERQSNGDHERSAG